VADETPTAGWALTNITCTGVAAEKITIGGSAGFVTGDTDVSVELTPGETATCTYTNTKLGSITIEKATVGDVGAFTFMGTDVTNDAGIITSPFLLSTDLNDADPSSILYSGLLPGQYLFSETVPGGWEIDGVNGDIICTGPDGFTSSWTPGSNSLDITLTNGEDLVCTFTNTRQATIIVEKTTDPTTTLQGFSFTGDVSGGPLTNGGTLMTENLSPGTYTSTETPVAGWDLTDITCDDGDSTGDTGTGIATFNAAAGEIITCTFTNTIQRGNIIVDKVTDPVGSPQVFDFTSSWAGGFGLADGTTPHNSGPLLPTSESDTYSVSEALPAGWDQTSATCDNGSDPGSIDLAPGETVTCTFTNTQRGTITLIKNLPNDSGGTAIETDFQAFIDANPVPWGIPQEFIPGDYMASETTLPGYTASGWFNACAADGSVTLGAGETLTCEITNDDDPASLVLIKRVINGTALPSDFELTLTGTDGTHDSGVTYFSGAQPPVLSGVSYTLSELAGQVPNYIDDGVACTDDVGGSAVTHPLTLNAGQSVTCTQTNRYVPLLPMIPVPVNDKLALLLLALMMLATGWYFKPAVIRKI